MGQATPAATGHDHSAGDRGWVVPLARAGYAAKGLVYVAIGWLAAAAGLGAGGNGGDAAGSREAIATMAREAGGAPVLWLIGLGLVGYVVWRMVQAVADPEDEGGGRRAVFLVSGLLYAGLALWTLKAASGLAAAASAGEGSSDWTATLMRQPLGRWLVMVAGAAVVLYGLVELWKAYRAKVADHLGRGLPPRTRRWVVRSARVGLVARGIVMLIIGSGLVLAGWKIDPMEEQGLGGALQTVREQPYGPPLMGLIGIGLAAYGVYQLVLARYRRIAPSAR